MQIATMFLLIISMTACAPFYRGTVDNRPAGLMQVKAVNSNAEMELSDGRLVRLYGLKIPDDVTLAQDYVVNLRGKVMGHDVSTEDILNGNPPAVTMTVWHRAFICGTGLNTWNANAKPLSQYSMQPVAANMAIQFEDVLNEADLSNPAVDQNLKDSLRRSHQYGIEYRAGTAK